MSRSRSGGRFEEFGRVDTEIGESINFDRLAGTDDTSWNKAEPYESDIETVSRLGFKVRSPDGEEWHHVVLAREGDHHVGLCDCKGWEYNDGPCVHLCAVRKAAWTGVTPERDINGRTVRICDLDAADAAERRYPYLTEKQREAYLACELGDTGVREFQRAQGYSSPGTVSNRLRVAREKVHEHEQQLRADGGRDGHRDPVTDGRHLLGEGVSR
ncbi:SWIM zinc finger family protein [Halorubrum sp. SP9]|uniref:SWIM zinc finger family protein n=1 Tax=Halorubrum sp. SP9 TaxID=1537267 RepID=UPI0010F48936|nr:SWIM zinc finger family protein [Halorubrum sp. SP9]TKX70823.1 SWIM zinc finger family protein [Halorubrum sp. SP9]